MFIKKQETGRVYCSHHQCQSLALTTGEQTDRLLHSVFKTHMEQGEPFPEFFLVCFGDMRKPTATTCSQGQVFFNSHTWGAAQHGILEKTAYFFCPGMFRLKGNIFSVKKNTAAVSKESSRDSIKQ